MSMDFSILIANLFSLTKVYGLSICLDKMIFVQDNIRFVLDKMILSSIKIFFVQDKNSIHGLKIIYALGTLVSSHGQNFCLRQKIFCPRQNHFVLYKYDFVPDKKYFVQADGQGISLYKN